jgi:glycosyltransferase involved in cell wall biosynthesis
MAADAMNAAQMRISTGIAVAAPVELRRFGAVSVGAGVRQVASRGTGSTGSFDNPPRVAVVHDYLTQFGGAERVALAMMNALPAARMITSCYAPAATFPGFRAVEVETMRLNRWRAFRRDPRLALPILAKSFNNHRVEDVDAVLCSSSGWSHGIATDAPKIVYCHNPARWLYQPEEYFGRLPAPLRNAVERRSAAMRRWDKARASEAAVYLVNSTVVRERVLRQYGIEARIVPPPPGLTPDGPMEAIPGVLPGYLLSVARARGYKNVASVAQAVEALPGERLVAVGGLPDHPEGGRWSERLVGVTRASDAQLRWLYANAAALVANSREDFGLTPIEAFGFGTPVLAIDSGGYLDTCVSGRTGLWIEDSSRDGVIDSIERFRASSFDSHAIRAHATRWSPQRFAHDLAMIIDEVVVARRNDRVSGGEFAYQLQRPA